MLRKKRRDVHTGDFLSIHRCPSPQQLAPIDSCADLSGWSAVLVNKMRGIWYVPSINCATTDCTPLQIEAVNAKDIFRVTPSCVTTISSWLETGARDCKQ